jgi:UDP-GlcNAc:undecaprenyl-phosphate GlcNAc-1-phosphate transferase
VAIHPYWLPAAAGIPLAALVLVAAMNSFNFLDNIDGQAAGTAAIAAGALALTTMLESGDQEDLWLIGCAGAGTCAGFLPLNYRPRRPAALFMGDAGAHLLGLIVGACAVLAMGSAGHATAAVAATLLILALPILDTSLVVVVRLAEKRPIWLGGRDHVSHRLVYMGLGDRAAVAVLLLFAAACAGLGLAVLAAGDPLATGAAIGLVGALMLSLGSRLALVTEERAVDRAPAAVEDLPLGRERALTDDLRPGIIQPQAGLVAIEAQDDAQTN